MKKKIFAFDLDGTLLNSSKQISDANIGALAEMKNAGHHIVFATGRIGSSVLQYRDLVPNEFSTVSLNGAVVYSGLPGHSSVLLKRPLPEKFARQIVSFYSHERDRNNPPVFIINYYFDEILHTEERNKESLWAAIYQRETKTPYSFVDAIDSLLSHEPEKILFVGDPAELDRVEHLFQKTLGEDVYIVRTWDKYLEFINKKVDKGDGVEAVAKSLGFSMKDVISFGDGNNDTPLLQRSGFSVAVGNASDQAKASAHYISPFSNNEDAIAQTWNLIKTGQLGI